jgi:hypothetical protein
MRRRSAIKGRSRNGVVNRPFRFDPEVLRQADDLLAAGQSLDALTEMRLEQHWIAVLECEGCGRKFCTRVVLYPIAGAAQTRCRQCRGVASGAGQPI